jgi:transcription elongation factor GreB
MSKAFTREDDNAPNLPLPLRPASTLPPGVPNYITPDGANRLRMRLTDMIERRQTMSGDSDAKRRLDLQILQLQQSLDSATVLGPPPPPWNEVKFGAIVSVRDQTREKFQYRIVGVDEADPAHDQVSWCSPVARALLNAQLGQRVRVQIPAGDLELEIIGIHYPQA